MAKKKSMPKSSLLGRWRITSMSMWDEDYLNEEVQAFIEFEPGRRGEFHFGYVHGIIDYRDVVRDGRPAVEFSWDGNDKLDRARVLGQANPVDFCPESGKIWICLLGVLKTVNDGASSWI